MMHEEPELLAALRDHRCPDCSTENEMREGPRGGLSVNIECRQCRARFNVAPIPERSDFSQLMFAQRIPREDEGGGKWPAFAFQKGDHVIVTFKPRSQMPPEAKLRYRAHIQQASPNGYSLIIAFDEGAFTPLPVSFAGDDYTSLITGHHLDIEPARQ